MSLRRITSGVTGAVIALLWCALASPALAEEEETIGPGLYPAITVSYLSDSNIFRTDENENSDEIFKALPSLTLKSMFRKHTFEGSYFVEIFRYREFDDEDFEDQYLDGDLMLDLTRRLQLEFIGDYASAHEMRGTPGTRLAISREPDTWWASRIAGKIIYGRRESKNQLILTAEGYRRRYTNNEQEPRSRNRQIYTLTFFHNRKERTRFVLEGKYKTFDYFDKRAPIDLTSVEKSILLGITWEATAKTTGTFKIGWLGKDLDDPAIPDFSGLSLESEIVWEPRTYSEFTLMLVRATKESPQTIGSFFVSTEVGLVWDHEFNDRTTLHSKLHYQRDQYETISDIPRDDDLFGANFEIEYNIWRWVDFGVSYEYGTRRSNFPDIDFIAHIFTAAISFDTMQ